jgi:hypothetical protein
MVADTDIITTEERGVDEKKELLSKAELSIWLDTYDDIFSDFDSRPYSERTLSDDFIHEARKMAKGKPTGRIELKLLMPKDLRNKETEVIIIKALRQHFKQAANATAAETKQIVKRGILSALFGVILMVIASYIINLPSKNFFVNTILVILEPAAWFLLWTGFDFMIYRSGNRKNDLSFNNKMAHAEITFLTF